MSENKHKTAMFNYRMTSEYRAALKKVAAFEQMHMSDILDKAFYSYYTRNNYEEIFNELKIEKLKLYDKKY